MESVTKFGAFVEMEPGIEGVVHISALSHDRAEQPTEVVRVGDEIRAVVNNVEPGKHKIGLRVKDVDYYQSSSSRPKASVPYDGDPSEFGRMLTV